jgi:hypothetical protein
MRISLFDGYFLVLKVVGFDLRSAETVLRSSAVRELAYRPSGWGYFLILRVVCFDLRSAETVLRSFAVHELADRPSEWGYFLIPRVVGFDLRSAETVLRSSAVHELAEDCRNGATFLSRELLVLILDQQRQFCDLPPSMSWLKTDHRGRSLRVLGRFV